MDLARVSAGRASTVIWIVPDEPAEEEEVKVWACMFRLRVAGFQVYCVDARAREVGASSACAGKPWCFPFFPKHVKLAAR